MRKGKETRKMDYRKFGNTYVIRMDRGEEIVRTLTDFCKKENVTLGSVDALGAADHAVIGLYDVETREFHKKTFDEPLEISSLHGNISTMNGEIYLHLHINLAREDLSVVGGHLAECRLSATCEMFVRSIDGTVERRHDDDVTGLNLYDFV